MTAPSHAHALPSDFVWKRLHSLAGIFLVLFLIVHLLTNSQAALLFGRDGSVFVGEVELIHGIPYLVFVEIFLLGVPFAIHMVWGIRYLWTSAPNVRSYNGHTPSLPYGRNRAYSWQRITSWILLLGVIAHVVQMRFLNYAVTATYEDKTFYLQPVLPDPGLASVIKRLNVRLMTSREAAAAGLPELRTLGPHQLVAIAGTFGAATLLMIRETFKSREMALLYTVFVIAACFHAFNGLWSASLSWGLMLSERTQRGFLRLCQVMMLLTVSLGLLAIWGTYWIHYQALATT